MRHSIAGKVGLVTSKCSICVSLHFIVTQICLASSQVLMETAAHHLRIESISQSDSRYYSVRHLTSNHTL